MDETAGLVANLHALYEAVGKPPVKKLISVSTLSGYSLGRSTTYDLLKLSDQSEVASLPTVSTTEAFVAACLKIAADGKSAPNLQPGWTNRWWWQELHERARAEFTPPSPAASDAPGLIGELPVEPAGFVERGTIGRLSEALGDSKVAVVCAITGMRGVGKTHVAAAYARARLQAGCPLVGWVNAETTGDLMAGLARIADRIGVGSPDGDPTESARRLREHLATRDGDSLIVFDNAVDPDAVRGLLPAVGNTHVVITSTDQAFNNLGTPVQVDTFSRPESIAYLEQITSLDDDSGADRIADELGDLPLALACAAAVINSRRLSYDRYLELVSHHPVTRALPRVPGHDYPHAVDRAVQLSVESITADDSTGLAPKLLSVIAVLSPHGVRRDLLTGLADSDADPFAVEDALELCIRGSVLSWSVGGDAVIMHRLTSRAIREQASAAGELAETIRQTIDLLEPNLFDVNEAFDKRELGVNLVASIESLWQYAVVAGPALVETAVPTAVWAVNQLRGAPDYPQAIRFGISLVDDSAKILASDHPQSLLSRYALGQAYNSASRHGDAVAVLESCVADSERVLGRDARQTISSIGELATAFHNIGRMAHAIALRERAVADNERTIGPDARPTLQSRDLLAGSYQIIGRLQEAITLRERTVEDEERVLGRDHFDTLRSRTNLAESYHSAGRTSEAVALQETTVADYKRVRGVDHPSTLMAQGYLSRLYYFARRLDDSIELSEACIDSYRTSLGPDHPETLRLRLYMGSAYRGRGHFDDAIRIHEANLQDQTRILGADHADTITGRAVLLESYMSAKRFDEAIDLEKSVVADFERTLGPDHLFTLSTRANLARRHSFVGRFTEALPLHERIVVDVRRILGDEHPETLRCLVNLALAYRESARADDANRLMRSTLTNLERILGPDHHDSNRARTAIEEWSGTPSQT